MVEVWHGIKDHPLYEVSNYGNVRNRKTSHVLTPMWNGRAKVRLSTKPRIDRDVAHLVAEYFIGSRPIGYVIMHLDDNPKNNRVTNLKWGTHRDNSRDMASKGRGGFQVLSAEVVAEIRARRSSGERGRVLAIEYGVSEQRVCDILKGRTTL